MKNIFILPTDKPSKLYIRTDVTPHFYSNFQGKAHNIYITSDEVIKEDDWGLSLCDDESYEEIYQCKDISLIDEEDRKIILTTDPQLIKEGVQAIPDEFLEWFCKNSSCEEVEVEYIKVDDARPSGYNIILPKEEPTFVNMKCTCMRFEANCFSGMCKNCGFSPKEEPKQDFKDIEFPQQERQETLEEAYNKIYNSIDFTEFDFASFAIGAKWQQERSYSDEDMREAFKANYTPFSATNIGDFDKDYSKWFNQFKKK